MTNFFDLVQDAYPEASLSKNMARQIKEMYGCVEDTGEPVLMMLPVRGQPRQFDVSRPLKEACSSLVTPIVDGIQELIARFDPEFQRPLLDNILLSGGGSQITGLGRLIEVALAGYGGGKVTRINDCTYAGAAGAEAEHEYAGGKLGHDRDARSRITRHRTGGQEKGRLTAPSPAADWYGVYGPGRPGSRVNQRTRWRTRSRTAWLRARRDA